MLHNNSKNLVLEENRIAYVPQEPRVFSGTLKENLLNDKEESKAQDIEKVLKIVRLENLNAEECVINENGDNFSKGQLVRIVLARALLQDSDILMLDELDANIDETMLNEIIEDIGRWRPGYCIIAISHNKDYQAYRDFRRILIKDKAISELAHPFSGT